MAVLSFLKSWWPNVWVLESVNSAWSVLAILFKIDILVASAGVI